jgi:hypothetical protein
MKLSNINRARIVRDGAIDAMAALNAALTEAIDGLEGADRHDMKMAFGRVMGEIAVELMHPTVKAFPELEPSNATWTAVVKASASERASRIDPRK